MQNGLTDHESRKAFKTSAINELISWGFQSRYSSLEKLEKLTL